MEGDRIYQESLQEVRKIQRSLAATTITIEVDKLDSETRGAVVSALANALSKRALEIQKVLTGVR